MDAPILTSSTNVICVSSYKSQHQAFVAHTMQQIQQLEIQKQAVELNNQEQNEENHHNNSHFNNNFNDSFQDNMYDNFSNNQYGSESGDYTGNNASGNENSYDSQTFDQINIIPKRNSEIEEPDLSLLPNVNFSLPPPGFVPEPPLAFQNGLPDLSKPPPGFMPFTEVNNDDLMPSVPYFELPAGLMVPLVQVIYFVCLPFRVRKSYKQICFNVSLQIEICCLFCFAFTKKNTALTCIIPQLLNS